MAGVGSIPDLVNKDSIFSEESDDFDLIEHRQALAKRAYQQGTQFVSINVILKELDLLHYLDDFLQADSDMIENYVHRSDEEVDWILRNVEEMNRFKFPYPDRMKLWKSLRYRWFKSPEFAKSFVHSSEIPQLILPKKDFKVRDSNIDFKLLDSDRQRMIVRKAVYDEIEGTSIVQEEIYHRQTLLFYELLGLEGTIQFWLNQDPRKMSREDPREEVFLTQMKSIELQAAILIDQLKLKRKIKKLVLSFFWALKLIFLTLSCFFIIVAILNSNSSNSTKPPSEIFYSSSHLRCAALYLMTFFFIFEITKQRQKISNYDKAKKMHAKCRFMYNDMISFRLKTHHIRQQTLNRYVDDAKIVEEPVRRVVRKSSSNLLARNNAMVISDNPYDEYIGTGVLSAQSMDNIIAANKVSDLPEDPRNSNPNTLDLPSVLPPPVEDPTWGQRISEVKKIDEMMLASGEPILKQISESSSDDFDEDDGVL